MPQDKRRSPRKSLTVEFQGSGSDGNGQLQFEGSDLSAGGTFLKSDLLLEEGERLSMRFSVPGLDRSLTALARVAWVRRFPKDDEPPGMGIEFLGMSLEDTQILRMFLDAP